MIQQVLPWLLVALLAAPTFAEEKSAAALPEGDALHATIAALDAAVFEAFNHCSDPEQLQKHATYFAPDLEFYHDNAGVTWSREKFITDVEKNVCGNYSRELVPGTLKVYRVHDFGAIAQGVHRFCHFDTGKCEGMADFVMVWRFKDGEWQITRALSYGHRASVSE